MNPAQTALLAWGLVAHCFADWFLQTHWQAQNKTNLKHPAAYIHAWLHWACAMFVFPWPAALLLAVAHLLIDTRLPLVWWGKLVRQSTPEEIGPVYVPFAMGRDQAAHVLCIALAAWWCGR